MPTFFPTRLTLARQRRRLSLTDLSEKTSISRTWLTAIEAGKQVPSEETVQQLSFALAFPPSFFTIGDVDLFDRPRRETSTYTRSAASFRSHYGLRVRDRDSVLAMGVLAEQIAVAVSQRFVLPNWDIPDLRNDDRIKISPEDAATAVRELWGLADRPIGNLVHLLEAKGARVFWLHEDVHKVDAFSFWRHEDDRSTPFVILNKMKSGERSRFDAAHELGHLVLHREDDVCGKEAENEADRFAGAFLMPATRAVRDLPPSPAFGQLLALKPKWRMSVAAMIKRGSDTGLYNDWQSKSAWIKLNQMGWRKGEPDAIPHEESLIFPKVRELLAKRGETLDTLAADLKIPSGDFWPLIPMRPEPPQPRNAPTRLVRAGHLTLHR